MSGAEMPKGSLRAERAEVSRLVWALVISLAFHLLFFGTYQGGKRLGWWQNLHWPAWMEGRPKMITELFKKKDDRKKTPEQQSDQIPLMFVEVSPAQAVTEAPKEAKYYSDKNSRAANPQADKNLDVPKITGTQTQVVKTEDTSRPKEQFTPLQPSPPTPKAQEQQEELKPKPALPPGDLTMAKPEDTPRKDPGEAPRARPRTIKEALARQSNSQRVPGEKMQQEGGVKRHLEIASLDAKATPFGAYDAALVEAISQRWFSLLEQRSYASDGRGKVVLQFRLHYDGRITEMSVAENNAGEMLGLICQKAVLDPAPFAIWPTEMRRMLGDIRNIQFTFYYN